MSEEEIPNQQGEDALHHHVIPLSGLYESWFLDYASYVILDRAVPHLDDGLKPVQRRILHSMRELEDGRYNKVANVIGNTMKYHPHGDASIGDAMVQLGQKNLLIDTQGNWGNIYTGDSAAAPRYIEARLSKFALEVVFNPETTVWQQSYDGRNREPVTLPVKFPLLLAQGVEGIAVGLATKILPHNFNELIDASIGVLKGEKPDILPDFPTGGSADFSKYNGGLRGGKVRIRSKIVEKDKKTLIITEIPFGTTTTSLIDSVIAANDKGKIKIRKIEDNTAKNVEIVIHLAPGISPDITIDALYAFTDCEVSISPNACIIFDDKPHFISVNEILTLSAQNTKQLLKKELEIRLNELHEKWHFSSLEKIFIENRIYHDIEECETWEAVLQAIDKGLEPFKPSLKREVTTDDIIRLTEIKIKRISKFDGFKADEQLRSIEEEIKEVKHHLKHLTEYAIAWFVRLKEKYGKDRQRKTEIKYFDTVSAAQVALANVKLYVNRADGFIGYGLKKDEYVCDCSDLDDIIVFRSDGKFMVTRVAEKTFVGKDIIHASVFKKNDDRAVFHLVYRDGASGKSFIKRFSIGGITRDKEYDLTQGSKGTQVLYFSENPNGESEIITVHLKPMPRLKKLVFDIDFGEIAVKGRGSMGNTLTKYPVKKIVQKSRGVSTLGGRKIWFDDVLKRLNADGRGTLLGSFAGDDKILAVYGDGTLELTNFDLTNHYQDDLLFIQKYDPEKVVTAVYYEGGAKTHYVKRFRVENMALNKQVSFISESSGSKLILATLHMQPVIEVNFAKEGKVQPEPQQIALDEFIDVKGWKAIGNKLAKRKVSAIKDITPVTAEPVPVQAVERVENSEENHTDEPAPAKRVDLEITNIDDIEIREEKTPGQLGLF